MTGGERRNTGAVLAESAAAICLIVPLMIFITFAIVEVSQAYMIREILSQAAREAARDLAIAYGQNAAVATSRTLQNSLVFDNVRIVNVVADDRQFSDPVFSTNGTPPTVTVTVSYTSGLYGLATFPSPDPLRLGNSLVLSATSTYRLE